MGMWIGLIAGWLVIGIVFGCIAESISRQRGYEFGGFAWGFWLWIIGIIVVGFGRDLNRQSELSAIENKLERIEEILRAEKKTLTNGKCPICGTMNESGTERCGHCNHALS